MVNIVLCDSWGFVCVCLCVFVFVCVCVCLRLFYWFDLRHSVFCFVPYFYWLSSVLILLMTGLLYVTFLIENVELRHIISLYY
jgi:hypothetical protein